MLKNLAPFTNTIACNLCNVWLKNTDNQYWMNAEDAEKSAKINDWNTEIINGESNHLCPNCVAEANTFYQESKN